ncbi:MAG: hypothetical protein LBL66_05235 [Clostridiales bacterium]|nr:hypothetical protein [Clostridiales bacterium]
MREAHEYSIVCADSLSGTALKREAADNTKSRSLKSFAETRKPDYAGDEIRKHVNGNPSRYTYYEADYTNKADTLDRVSAKNLGFENGIRSVSLYAVFCVKL